MDVLLSAAPLSPSRRRIRPAERGYEWLSKVNHRMVGGNQTWTAWYRLLALFVDCRDAAIW